MKILGISGSLREGSYNTLLLAVASELVAQPVELEVFDLAGIPFYNEDDDGEIKPEPVLALLAAIESSDALLLATPEYNHSVPALLKNAIDWASRPAFKSVLTNKPAGILSASMSSVGGARAQMHLKDILASTLTPVYPCPDYLLPMAQNSFSADGDLTDATATRRLQRYINEFASWAAVESR